jgi:hypothetical protein
MERTIPLTIYLFICFSPSVAIIVFIEMHLVLISNFILASAVLLAIYLPRPLGHCQNADRWDFSPEKPTIFQVLATAGGGLKGGASANDVPCSSMSGESGSL